MNESIPGRKRRVRHTSRAVRVVDRLARVLITVGGIGTIVAVSTLCLFLVWVVVPLFLPPSMGQSAVLEPEGPAGDVLAVGLDEYSSLGWSLSREGELNAFRLADGRTVARKSLFDGVAPDVLAVTPSEGSLTVGIGERVRLGTIGFTTRFLEAGEATHELERLEEGETAPMAGGVVERTTGNQLRLQELSASLGPALDLEGDGRIVLVDHVTTSNATFLAALTARGGLHVSRGTKKTNLLTGEETLSLREGEGRIEWPSEAGAPRWLALTGAGENVLLLWEDGTLWRCNSRDLEAIRVVEKTKVLAEGNARVTAASFLIGRNSLAIGDSFGRVGIWFRIKPEDPGTPDGVAFVKGHELGGGGAAVSALAPSARTRLLAVGHADGELALFHVTGGRELLRTRLPGESSGSAVQSVVIGPKDDTLLAACAGGMALWHLDIPHPEAGLASIFAPVWYEGHPEPAQVWQSSSGTDDSEPKYGIYPLVFGTVKATFYSLLFGVPIALLAALYTSEFCSSRQKARVKPVIEMMASLPSVVLGFLSALVLAPLVEDVVPGVLMTILAIPFAICAGGYVWRALPQSITLPLERWRLGFVGLCAALGLLVGVASGPLVERLFFAGDMRQWLTGSVGNGTGGWMILLLPLVAMVVGWTVTRRISPRLLFLLGDVSRRRFALLDLAKFLLASAATVLLAWGLALALSRLGYDPRGGFLDTYVQRNALVVGFVMGFAIIPIVYTIAEDALSAVPDHLRAASLGAGATPWQTAVRVVVPTAMSGIFSAVMIGFGRAVGETMIVLMAAGNTPIMEWNVFNGFRTLSANIAVELPEAVQGSTHYRMLFLAALVLFAMTFVLNTLAEIVRLRYRKRRVQL